MASTGKTGDEQGRRRTCPICSKEAAPRGEPCYPFCSKRCQLIDLGHWLDEDYRIPDADGDQSSSPGGSFR